MKKLYSAPTAITLQVIKSKLEAEGINCFIREEFPAAAGEVPRIVCWPTLCVVDDDQFEMAEKILSQIIKDQNSLKQPWICQSCNVEVDGELEICWNCQSTKDNQD